MKTIYLIRHAKSSWKKPVEDFERGLNKRGKKDLEFMPSLIKTKTKTPDMIISSPAKRAKKTAQGIAKKFDLSVEFESLIYEASHTRLLEIIHMLPKEIHTVFIILLHRINT